MTGASTRVLTVFCDVGPRHGVGHLMRCLALAEEFSAQGWTVVVAADVHTVPFALAQVEARGFARVPAPAGGQDHIRVLAETGAYAAVVDSYHLARETYAEIAAAVPTLALVDGDPDGRIAHLLVDQNIGAEDDHWPVPGGSTRIAGLDYALMRTEILQRRPAGPRRTEAGTPRVFAFFGGTDAFGAGPVLTRALVASGAAFDLRVVAPQPWAEVVEPGPGQRIEVIGPTDRLAEEVLDADLVVSAAGTSSWELLCLGAACAFVCVADNQELSYGRAVEAGLGLGLGSLAELASGDQGPASRTLGEALGDSGLRATLRERAWNRVDGGGRARVRERFETLLG